MTAVCSLYPDEREKRCIGKKMLQAGESMILAGYNVFLLIEAAHYYNDFTVSEYGVIKSYLKLLKKEGEKRNE